MNDLNKGRFPSVQTARLGIEAIEDGIVQLRGGQYRAVLEVGSVNFGLRGEVEREAILASYAAFLNSLTFPVQLLVRALPVDIGRYLGELDLRARDALAETPLAALARDHVAFVRRLARSRILLERRFYLIVPAGTGADAEPRRTGAWATLVRLSPRRARLDAASARTQLTFRCGEVARQLARCELTARRLDDQGLAQLFYACWSPELARLQRLRRTLADYTALVVTAVTPVPRGQTAERS